MIVLLILMLLLLAPALWAYIYIWRGLNRRVIAAVKVVDHHHPGTLRDGGVGGAERVRGSQYMV